MPEPNRAPWLVEPAIAGMTVGRLVEQQVAIDLVCHACHHRAHWPAVELRRRLRHGQAATIREIARRLRCGRCKSEWIEVGRG